MARLEANNADSSVDLSAPEGERQAQAAGINKRSAVVAELHQQLRVVKKEKTEAAGEAEDREELAKVLTLTVDQRQEYEDHLKQQLQSAGVAPLSWSDFRAKRGAQPS